MWHDRRFRVSGLLFGKWAEIFKLCPARQLSMMTPSLLLFVLGETFRHPVYLDSSSSFFFRINDELFFFFFSLQFHFFQTHEYKPIITYGPCKTPGR